MSRPALIVLVLFVAAVGCGKSTEPPAVADNSAPAQPPAIETPAAPGTAAAVAQADLPALLVDLTQAVRKYGAEQRRAPKNLEELVAAGYLGSVPSAPAGQRFVIDKNLQVVVADR